MRISLATVKPGQVFTYGGVPWIKLDGNCGFTLALAAESVFDRAFNDSGERDEGQYNNWALSSLRRELNEDFLETLIENGAEVDAFLNTHVDLTAEDGLTDYGTTTDKITLISCDQYREYRKLIPNLDTPWWTVTAYSCNAADSCYVRYVSTDGTLLSDNAYFGHWGVRPLCNLSSEIFVSVEGEKKTLEARVADLEN